MGKSKGGIAKGGKGQCPEAYQRMNFLYQAAVLMTRTYMEEKQREKRHEEGKMDGQEEKDVIGDKEEEEKVESLVSLGRFYTNTMKSIGRKQVLRL